MRKLLSTVIIVLLLFAAVTCKRKDEKAIPKLPEGPITGAPAMAPSEPGQKVKLNLVVPPAVKDKWSSVKLIFEDKKSNKKQELIAPLGGELKIPGSGLTVAVGDFLPDFKMSGEIITSASNMPNNPTVGVRIYENGQQLFPETGEWGWLYSKFPTIHPFQHERYALTLKEGIEKK